MKELEEKNQKQPVKKKDQTKLCRLQASLTIEAALCLPLFLFAAICLIAPIKMLDEKRRLQNLMEGAAKDLSQAIYVQRLIEKKGNALLNGGQIGGASDLEDGVPQSLVDGFNTAAAAARIFGGLNYDMIRNPYFETCGEGENDMIEFALCYEMRLPVSLFGVERIPMRSVVSRRAWTGAEGGRGAALYGGQSGTDEEGYSRDEDGDRTVYIGKTSTVYHKDRSCHYLDNVLKKVSAEDVDALRSRSGGRYHACEGCRPEKQGEVYILESGTAYHRSADCGSISAYAREIKLKDAAHLGPCSYCTKKS